MCTAVIVCYKSRLGLQPHERAESGPRVAARPHFHKFSGQHERYDHCSSLIVEIGAVAMREHDFGENGVERRKKETDHCRDGHKCIHGRSLCHKTSESSFIILRNCLF